MLPKPFHHHRPSNSQLTTVLQVGYPAENETVLEPKHLITEDSPLLERRRVSREEEKWEMESKGVELAALVMWIGAVSAFVLINNFVGPWPEFMGHVHERVWFVCHMLGGMLFGGGVILTTVIEWMVAQNKNGDVLSFWFDKVPLLDAAIVLPGLTLAMISGIGLAIVRYGGLAIAPHHIQIVFWTLVAFAAWWALTDLTTQGGALTQVNEWAASTAGQDESSRGDVPRVVRLRKISNILSCIFVILLYSEMVFKPGTLHY
jgi:hypothetical protein